MTAPLVPSGSTAAPGGAPRAASAAGSWACGHLPVPAWLVDGTIPGDPRPVAGGQALPPALIGGFRWIEHRLFEVVGGWVADEPCPSTRVLFSVLSRQHGEHAGLLAERLPARAGVDPDALTLPPPGWVDVLDLLAGSAAAGGTDGAAGGAADGGGGAAAGAGGSPGEAAGGGDAAGPDRALAATLARLVGLGRVALPRLAGGYAGALRGIGPADAPAARTLRSLHAASRDAWGAVEVAADRHVTAPGEAVAAAAWQGRLQAVLAGASLRPVGALADRGAADA